MMKLASMRVILAIIVVSGVAQADLLTQYEFEGNYEDSVPGGPTGTPNGGATIVIDSARGNVLWVQGTHTGSAANDYVEIGNDALGAIQTTQKITVMGWIKSNGANGNLTQPFGKGYNWRAHITDTGSSAFQVMDTTPNAKILGVVDINTDQQWHHVAGTYDGQEYNLYIDGVADGSAVNATGAIPDHTSNKFAIGAWIKSTNVPPVKRGFNGNIDDVRVYNHVLTLQDIRSLLFQARNPSPGINVNVGVDLAQLSWVRPEPVNPSDTDPVLCDVLFDIDPNMDTAVQIETKLDGDSTTNLPTLDFGQTYYWKVNCYDPNDYNIAVEGPVWYFTAGNLAPVVFAGADKVARLTESTVTVALNDATVEDDGLPEGETVTQTWTVEKPEGSTVVFDPDNGGNPEESTAVNPNITVDMVGTYLLRLTATDTDLTSFDEVEIFVPNCANVIGSGFALPGDISGPVPGEPDCAVNLLDFFVIASYWLYCNDPQVAGCVNPFEN